MAPILSRAIRNARAMMRSSEWGDYSIPPNSMTSPWSSAFAGIRGAEVAALSIGTVLSCVKALHDDVKILPFGAYQGDRDGPHKRLGVQPQIVEEPFGPDLPPAAGFGQIVVSKAMRGNGYCYVVSRDRRTDLPSQLTILHPDTVGARRDSTGEKYFQVGQERFSTREIIHITGLMLPGAIQGIDLLTYQRVTFALAREVGAYAEAVFSNGGQPSGVISVPGAGNRAKAREVKEAWEANHSGVANAHRPAVMFGGATWQAMTVTPENAQFLETRRFLREEICGLYGVPLHRIQAIVENASQGGGKGLDAMDAGYVKHGILPTIVDIEVAWDRMIPGGGQTWTKFNADAFLRASAEIRASVAQIYRVTAVRTPDEIRADEGWEPLPDGKGSDPNTPLNSNASPTGGADNAPAPGGQGGNTP